MIDQFDLAQFRATHEACRCELPGSDLEDGLTRLEKEECEIRVEYLETALDCDACLAFTENDLRPDIISIQRCHEEYSWLVIEMKKTMRLHAAKQARAALERLGQDPMFLLDIDRAGVVFVVKRRRRADNQLMREIKTITAGNWRVIPRLRTSGDTIACR